uniref:FLZ-type domain-containing protein n=1 Tax=Lotharella oceanica TaxID=641309 RepID=A0A7S2TNX3_9EUKA|mmetsp:Transcript_2125/g.4068  ORF Transcript_2125/g.4068 Transcript_2125/m.4068 type:complete len:313 (+) Transcript_2125:76-1014(+)
MEPEPVHRPSLPRTASSRRIFEAESMVQEKTERLPVPALQEESSGSMTEAGGSNAAVPSLEEVEMAPVTPVEQKEESTKEEESASPDVVPGGRARFKGIGMAQQAKDEPLHKAGFQTVVVSLDLPIIELQQWVVAGFVHWELDGVKQISNALMYFTSAAEIQLLTVDGPVPAPNKNSQPLRISVEPLKRIRQVAANRKEIKMAQYKVRILEDIVEAKALSQRVHIPPCFAWPFAMAWWKKCTKKRKHMDQDDGSSGRESKDGSVDFTKCYACGTRIQQAVFMYLDHSFCSEKCRTRQMRRPYKTYTARPWLQ